MLRKLIPCFFFFVIVIHPVFSADLALYHHPEASLQVQINEDPRYSAKLQMEEGVSYGFSFFFLPQAAVFLGFGFSNVHDSSFSEGFQYRGFGIFTPSIGISGRLIRGEHTYGSYKPVFAPGLSISAGFNFAWYTGIDRAFFYLSAQPASFIDFYFPKMKSWFLRFQFPVDIIFRRDLQFSIAPGFSVSFFHRLLPWPYGKEDQ